jgi:Putative 2OG-Fe(II) oxygenase
MADRGGETQWLWPTPIGLHRYPNAERVNPLLVNAFAEGRAVMERQRGVNAGPFFASDDDLLHRIKLPEWQGFVSFIVASIGRTAHDANQEPWAQQPVDIRVGIEGMWFQCSRAGAFHDIHTHGNCSWSGVYIVQIDHHAKRVSHPVYGDANGTTRLYGPLFERLGGAFVDVGNAYLQTPHQDIAPLPGQLLIFPSWLAHKAMPYDGELEQVIVSFNASLHAADGDQLHEYSPR